MAGSAGDINEAHGLLYQTAEGVLDLEMFDVLSFYWEASQRGVPVGVRRDTVNSGENISH